MSGAIVTVADAAGALRAIVSAHLTGVPAEQTEAIIASALRMHVTAAGLRLLEAAALDLQCHECGHNVTLFEALRAFRKAVKSTMARGAP